MTQGKDWADRRKALDPSIYRMKQYVLTFQCGSAVEGKGGGSETIDNTPFVLDTITHGIAFQPDNQQDGNYTLQFRDDQSVYNTFPALSQTLYGSVFQGNRVVPLPLRMFFRGSSSLTMEAINYTDRTGTYPEQFPIQIVFHGFERWDSPRE